MPLIFFKDVTKKYSKIFKIKEYQYCNSNSWYSYGNYFVHIFKEYDYFTVIIQVVEDTKFSMNKFIVTYELPIDFISKKEAYHYVSKNITSIF